MGNLDLVKQITEIEANMDQSLQTANEAAKAKVDAAKQAAEAKLAATRAELRNKRQAFVEQLKRTGEEKLNTVRKQAQLDCKQQQEEARKEFPAVLSKLYGRCLEHGNR